MAIVNKLFSRLVAMPIGDLGQLPPIRLNSLQMNVPISNNSLRHSPHLEFNNEIIFEENYRLGCSDKDTVLLNNF